MEVTEQVLTREFRALEDGPLLRAAAGRLALTELAQQVLLEEVRRRGLPLPDAEAAEAQPEWEWRTETWVTIGRFRDISSGIVARSALEAAEIE